MAKITQKGRELAVKIEKFCGAEVGLADPEACSLIARHTVSLHRVYEAQCNGHPAMGDPYMPIERANKLQERFEIWCDRREHQLTSRIENLAAQLPGISGVRFFSDPRGAPVRLVTMNGRGDSWDDPKAIVV
jgi:hypothetical protein